MGLSRFNQSSSSSSSGGGILYRPKPLTLPWRIYGDGSPTTSPVPVYRSGASDKSFESANNTSITLYTTSAAGVRSTTASISYTTYLGTSLAVAFHLNSADTCLYVLISSGGSFRIIKINDTTGIVTAIGSSFIPTTLANWGFGESNVGTLSVDSGSGHLKFVCNGFYHLINKTTGAIVSQDTAISIGSFLAKSVFYVTQDGAVGVTSEIGNLNETIGFMSFPNIVHSSYGIISNYTLPAATVGLMLNQNTTTPNLLGNQFITLVDNDKVCISFGLVGNASAIGAKYYLLSDFDKFIKSVADVGAGVI